MSTIVQMTSTVEAYQSGQTYRVRSKNKDKFLTDGTAVVLDKQPEPANTQEGV